MLLFEHHIQKWLPFPGILAKSVIQKEIQRKERVKRNAEDPANPTKTPTHMIDEL